MNQIFLEEAPKYWAKNIGVMPLKYHEKIPTETRWQHMSYTHATDEVRQQWLYQNPKGNIGLPLGPASNVCAIDIDTDDVKVQEALLKVLPKPKYIRKGAKGAVWMYKWTEQPNFKILDKKGKTVVEFLGAKNQVVMPPSVHPLTQQPYTSNVHLVDIIDELDPIPADLKPKLYAVLSTVVELAEPGASKIDLGKYVAQGGRDIHMTRHAGYLSTLVLRGEKTLLEALDIAHTWAEKMVEQTEGDPLDVNKAKAKVIEFILKDVTIKKKILPHGWDIGLTPDMKIQWNLNISDDQEERSAAELIDYITQQLSETNGPNDPKRHEIIKYVLNKLARSKTITKLEEDQILNIMVKQSGLGLSMASYRKELNQLRKSGDLEGINHTEIAQELTKIYAERVGEIRYANDKLWQWEGTHWVKLNENELWKLLATEYGHLPAAKRSSDHKGILEVTKKIVKQRLSDVPVEGINFANGFLNVHGELVPHNPEHGMTYVFSYQYKPGDAGKCPQFFQYLEDAWGEHADFEKKVAALQEAMAATFFGAATKYQKAFLLYGTGRTGKSVLLDILQILVPKEARVTIGPEGWGSEFLPAEFYGKFLNSAGEMDEKSKVSGRCFKGIVSGEEITARTLYQAPFSFKPTCAHWFCSNHLPKTLDTSNGFTRRWLIFKFDKLVPIDKTIPDLAKKIVDEEVEAIVAWIVDGMKTLKQRGHFDEPESSKELCDKMGLANSKVRQWFEKRVRVDATSKVTYTQLWSDFHTFSVATLGGVKCSPIEFKIEFEELLNEKGIFKMSHGEDEDTYLELKIKKI